ncbi:MAG: cysteine-rich CWC family protein [Pyrinomonadaceae bacterium]
MESRENFSTETAREKQCSVCGTAFKCGPQLSGQSCWCNDLPHLKDVTPERECLCVNCLSKAVQTDSARPTNVELSELIEGRDFYRENGSIVFTRAYHLKRGYCCQSGCRHCPYPKAETTR